MKTINKIIAGLISASVTLSGVNVFAEKPLTKKLEECVSAVELSGVISELTDAEANELNIDLTNFKKLAYPELAAEDIMLNGFSDNDEFKAAYDNAMNTAVEELNVKSSKLVHYRTEAPSAGVGQGLCIPGSINPRLSRAFVLYELPQFGELLGGTMVGFRNGMSYDLPWAIRTTKIKAYSSVRPDFIPDKTYAVGSDEAETWLSYADSTSANPQNFIFDEPQTSIKFDAKTGNSKQNTAGQTMYEYDSYSSPAEINENMLSAIENAKNNSGFFCFEFENSGSNIYYTGADLNLLTDNTKKWHNDITSNINDGDTGIYNLNQISIDYGAKIDNASWNGDNVKLINSQTGEKVNISVDTSGIIDITEPLESETSYILTVVNILDTNGNSLKNRRIYFTTAGIYKNLRIDSKDSVSVNSESDFKIYGEMLKSEVEVTDAVVTSSDKNVINYADGKINAINYGYARINVKAENTDGTTVEANKLITVPAVENTFDNGNEIGNIDYKKFAVISDFDDISITQDSKFGFKDLLIGMNDSSYTVNGADSEVPRKDGKHKVKFIYDNGEMTAYFDENELMTIKKDDSNFIGAEYVENIKVQRLNDTKPVINNLTVTGMSENDAVIGDMLTVSYEYYDADGDIGSGDGAWYICDSADGKYTKFADGNSVELKNGDESKYIKYIVTPINEISSGDEYSSEPIYISLGKTLEKILRDIQNTDSKTVEDILNSYSDIIEIDMTDMNKISQPSYVYGEMSNKTYAGIDDIVNAYNSAISKYLTVKEIPIESVVVYSTQEEKYIDATEHLYFNNSDRKGTIWFYMFKPYFTASHISDVEAIRDMTLAVYCNASNNVRGPFNAYYINDYWNSRDVSLYAEKVSADKETALALPDLNPVGGYEERKLPQSLIDNLCEDCSLTIGFNNSNAFTVHTPGSSADKVPKLKITYDLTALMLKEATVSIKNGESGVKHDLDGVNIDFLKNIDENTVNENNIYIVRVSDSKLIKTSISKVGENRYFLKLDEELADETAYNIILENIKTSDGESLNNQCISFTTEAVIKNLSLQTVTSMPVGANTNINVFGLTNGGNVIRMSNLNFTSSNSDVLEVDSNGNISAKRRGTSVISVSCKNYDGSEISKKIILNVYNHNENESFESNPNAVSQYSYSGAVSLPINGDTVLYNSKYNNYAELNYYADGISADGTVSFGGLNVKIKSELNSVGWHQIVFDNRSGVLKAYIDGNEVQNGTFTGDNTIKAAGSGYYVDNVNINDIEGTVCIAKNVAVRGSGTVGETLSVNYGYFDEDNDEENGTEIKWYYSSNENDGFKVVSTDKTYKTVSSGYIKAGVTPKNIYDVGTEVMSKAFKITSGTTATGGGGGLGSSIGRTATSNDSNLVKNQNKTFSDVTSSHWAYEAVMDMKEKGIIKGISENSFEPDGKVTRAQFAAMLVRAINAEAVEYNGEFTDVKKDDWYASDVQTAFNSGLINGFDGRFEPNENISREQMVKMVICAYKKLHSGYKADEYELDFSDIQDAADWSIEYIKAAVSLKIVSGVGGNKFAPKENATRAQAAVIIANMLR